MKKIFAVSASVLALSLVLAGCSSPAANQSTPTGQTASDTAARTGRGRQLDFGQPKRRADVRGVVKSIIGNEVTILKVDMPNRTASSTSGRGGNGAGANGGNSGGAAVSLTGGTRPAGGGGQGGFGGGAGGPGGPGGQNSSTRADMIARLKAMSTGEEKIIIPVGIQMMKTDTNTRTMVEASLADITADKSLTIWTTAGDNAATTTDSVAPTAGNATTTGQTASSTEQAPIIKIAEFVLIN